MNSPCCNSVTTVSDTRHLAQHQMMRRRRTCVTCGYKFTTAEIILDKSLEGMKLVNAVKLSFIKEVLNEIKTRTEKEESIREE